MTATDGGILPLIFLNALPAGGKSEIRRFLENTDPAVRRARFHIGDIVSLDDYPYVHFMRRIDDELNKVGFPSMFFVLPDRGFLTDLDWCTLIKLVSDDYYIAGSKIEPIAGVLMTDPSAKKPMPTAAARWIFSRIDRARASVGILRRISQLPAEVLDELACQLGNECLNFYKELRKNAPYDRTNKTVIIEFSRGASAGAELPFAYPLGYAHSYSKFENSILNNASVLYVSVSPEMSRAKNIARAIGAQSSSVPSGVELMTSLAHRVPDFVMYNSYGADDFVNSSGAYHKALLDGSNTDTVEIKVTIQPHSIDDVQVDFVGRLPLAILHNFEDKTTFARRPVGEWTEQMKAPLELELERALGCLYRKWSATHKKLVVP